MIGKDKKKKKPQPNPNSSNQSITSLVSVRSNEDDDEDEDAEVLENIYDIPKSQISIKSLSSDQSANQIKLRKKEKLKKKTKLKKRQKGQKKKKIVGSPKKDETKKEEDKKEEIKKEEVKKEENKMDKCSSSKQLKHSLPKIETLLSSTKRSSEPPPTLEDDSSLQFTPSEINLYYDNEKDLFGNTISKKQHTLVLENLKNPNIKIHPLKHKDSVDSPDQSSDELENLILKTAGSLEKDKLIPKTQSSPDTDSSAEDESEISKEITARFENLIMDPSIFEKAAIPTESETNEQKAQSSPLLQTVPPLAEHLTESVRDHEFKDQAFKEQIDNAVVLFTYKSKKKKEKKKKKKKKKTAEIRIGLIGAGKISEAIVSSLINSLKFDPNLIFISSPSGRNLELFKAKGCQTTKRNIDIFARYFCHIVFINVHGGTIRYCHKLGGIKPFPLTTTFLPITKHRYYILSLTTGITLDEIKNTIFNPDQISKYNFEIHRVLLNVCCMYGKSICGIDCEINQLSPVIRIFLEKFGELAYIPEKEMDAACAIGGCGLAFSYYFLNAISDGSVRIGLSKDKSIRLVAQIADSSVECLNKTQDMDLFYKKNSDRNTPTSVGLEHLKKLDINIGIENAVKAAYDRIVELAKTEIAPQF